MKPESAPPVVATGSDWNRSIRRAAKTIRKIAIALKALAAALAALFFLAYAVFQTIFG